MPFYIIFYFIFILKKNKNKKLVYNLWKEKCEMLVFQILSKFLLNSEKKKKKPEPISKKTEFLSI
jgi:hypothetical protein